MPVTIEHVQEALQVLHEPQRPAEQRQAAHNFCESIKEQDGESFALASQLVNPSMPATCRHFGFQLYEHLISKRWNVLGEDSHEQLKGVSLQMLSCGTLGILNEPRFIKEKAVQLVSHIAKREWPARWPDLFEKLTALTSQGDTQCELALLVLRSIGEGVFEDERMSDLRRNELLQALNNEYPSLFGFCFTTLESNYQKFGTSTDSETKSASRMLVSASLQTLEAYAPLASMPTICDSGVLPGLHAMLHSVEMRDQALDVLLAIVSKKSKDAPHPAFCGLIKGILESCGPGGLLAKFEYSEHKRLCLIMSNFGANHFYTIQGSCKSPCACGDASVREGFLQLMAYFTGYSALSVSEMTAAFWRNFLELQASEAVAPMPAAVQDALLVAIAEKLSPPKEDDVGDDDDVADLDELMKLWVQGKAKYLDILKRMAASEPERCVFFVGARWQAALQAYFAQAGQVDNQVAQDTFEALSGLIDFTIAGTPAWAFSAAQIHKAAQEQARSQVVGAGGMIIKMLLDAESEHTTDLVIAGVVFRTLPTMIPYLKEHPHSSAHIVMTMLSRYSTIQWQPSDDATRRSLVLNARRRISSSVVKLAQALATHLLPHRGDITNVAQGLLNSNAITSDEVAHIYELLFVLTNPLPSTEDQANFLRDVMSGPVAEWRSEANTRVLSGFQVWLHGTEVGGARESGRGEDAVLELRVKMQSIVMTLLCICRRCISGTAALRAAASSGSVNQHVALILPNLFTLVQNIHSVWLPQVMAGVSSAWQGIYRSVEYEVTADPEFRLGDDIGNSQPAEMCTWLRHSRDSSYQLIGMLCTFRTGFYGAIEADPGLLRPLSAHIPAMENRHLRAWIRLVVTPFSVYCPRHMQEALLSTVLAPVLALAYGRLSEGYAAMRARAGGNTAGKGAGGGGERESIVADQVLRLLHREMCDFALTALGEHPHTVAADKHGDAGGTNIGIGLGFDGANHEDLAQYLLGDCGSAAQVMILTLCSSIEWPDSAAATRAALALEKIIQRVKGDPKYHPMLAGELLRAVMHGLRVGESATNPGASETLLLHLFRDIYVNFAPITPLVDQELARLPGITPSTIGELREAVLSSNSEKKQRAVMRDFAKAWLLSKGAVSEQIRPIQRSTFVLARPQNTGMDAWSDEQREQCWAWLGDQGQ